MRCPRKGADPGDSPLMDALAPVWSFHSMVVSSGRSAVETASRADLLSAIAADPQLTTPSRQNLSFRIVTRQEVEGAVRMTQFEAARAERMAATETLEPQDDAIDVSGVALTPPSMALGLQRLIMLDRKMCLAAFLESREDSPPPSASTIASTGPVRVFLLVDFPATAVEVHALLLTGESGEVKSHQAPSDIPLLPLLDGVLLVVDPVRELSDRRKSLSLSEERRKSTTRRVSTEGKGVLLEDKSPPVDAASSVFHTANPFVKELYETANVGGLEWSDLVFVDLACCTSVDEVKTPRELLQDLEASVGPLISQKILFKNWVSSVKTIEIPAMDRGSSEIVDMSRRYKEILVSAFEPSLSVAALVWAMREAVARHGGDLAEDVVVDDSASVPNAFIDHGDEAAMRLAISYDVFVKQHFDDREPCFVGGRRIDTIEKSLWRASDLPGVGNCGRKSMPILPRLSAPERSVLDTEFSTFATIPTECMHLTRQLLRFEELLGVQWKGKLRIRDVIQPLRHDVLPQRLAALLRENPTVIQDYDEATDSLLVAVITSTAPGRFRTSTWSAREHVRHRPALRDWHQEILPPDDYLTPRTALAATACVSLSAGELGAVTEKCLVAFPADHSIIRVYQTPHAPIWLSVALDCDRFGLRPRSLDRQNVEDCKLFAMNFYANLEDGSQILIREGSRRPKKPDGHSSITLTLTSVDGVITTTCSDGTIVQQKSQSAESAEVYRVVYGKGVVVRVLSDVTHQILLPNGDVVILRDGVCQAGEDVPAASVERELVVDPETNALVEKRAASGAVIVTHTDGSRVTYHADGTVMYATPTRSHVLIKKSGLPDVCIDVDVNLTAQRHSSGERVAVTKGGLRTRSAVRLADGSEIYVQYNTKVVAEVNGRIIVEKPGGVKIVAKDSGRVEFSPRRTIHTAVEQTESADDADRDELSNNNVYYFNCREGTLSFVDHEQNHFRADIGDGRGFPSLTVDLAGVLSEKDAEKYEVTAIPARAVINDPIEPYLIVLRGDGTGEELLRPRDTRELCADASSREVSDAKPPPSSVSSNYEWWSQSSKWFVDRVFVRELCPRPARPWFNDQKVSSWFDRLMIPVATAYCLVKESCLPSLSVPEPQSTVVRSLRQLRPMSSDDVSETLAALEKWRQWQVLREMNKDRFRVADPRSADAIMHEVAMQRKVLAAIKATRARKKAERQRHRDPRKLRLENGGGIAYMETVQEGNEPHDDCPGDDDDDFDQILSDDSDENSHSDVDINVDDLEELMWAAFSQADAAGSGRLTLVQARHALVQVLGVGVTSAELVSQLKSFSQPEPFSLSFDVFVDVVHAFRDGNKQAASPQSSESVAVSPRYRGQQAAGQKPSVGIAAGSAAEAVRSFSLLRLNPSAQSDAASTY